MSWVDGVSVFGVAATLVGLWLTFRQARDAKDQAQLASAAADAASKAVSETQRQLRGNQLLILVPQLRWVAQELDDAIMAKDRNLARRHLDHWRHQAGHLNGVLIEQVGAPDDIPKALQESVALATASTASLMRQKKSVIESCEQARVAIGYACDVLTVYVGQSSTQARQESEVVE